MQVENERSWSADDKAFILSSHKIARVPVSATNQDQLTLYVYTKEGIT